MSCKREEEAVRKCKLQSRMEDLQMKLDICRASKIHGKECGDVAAAFLRCYSSFQGTGMYKGQPTDCVDPYLTTVRECLEMHQSAK